MKSARLLLPIVASVWAALFNCTIEAGAAGRKTLTWQDDTCTNTVAFDPAKVDETRLRNTVRILFGREDFEIELDVWPQDPQAVAKLDPNRLAERCETRIDAAERLQFLPLKGIEEHRRALVATMKDFCEFQTTKIRGFRNASALRDYQPAAACSRFVDALEGKTDTVTVFRQTVAQNCQQNASPSQCTSRGLADLGKPDGIDWARLYLLDFAWNNCAINYNRTNVDRDSIEQQRRALTAQFRREFRVVKSKCDSP